MSTARFVVPLSLAGVLLLGPAISLAQIQPPKPNAAPRKTLPAVVSAKLDLVGKGVYLPAAVSTSLALTGKGVYLPSTVNAALAMEGSGKASTRPPPGR